MTGCGSGASQAAREPRGQFRVSISAATFPRAQRIAEHTRLVISVRNRGARTIPDLAVTICNVSCADRSPAGQGSSSRAFAADVDQQYLANPARPVWIVDRPPGQCGYNCNSGALGGSGVTADSNTWALGSLKPGRTASFAWGVTAVAAGRHVVAWEVAAGLNGNARAVLADGSAPQGSFPVTISAAPTRSFVNNQGQIVTVP